MCSISAGSLHAASRLSYRLESSSTFSASVRAQMCLLHRGAKRDCTAHNKVRLGRLGGAPSPHVAGSLCCPEPAKDAPPLTVCPRSSGNGVRTPKRNLCSAFIRVKTKPAKPCGLAGYRSRADRARTDDLLHAMLRRRAEARQMPSRQAVTPFWSLVTSCSD